MITVFYSKLATTNHVFLLTHLSFRIIVREQSRNCCFPMSPGFPLCGQIAVICAVDTGEKQALMTELMCGSFRGV